MNACAKFLLIFGTLLQKATNELYNFILTVVC